MKKLIAVLVLVGLMLPVFAQPSYADWDHGHPHGRFVHADYWRGDIHHFYGHDYNYWRGGHWWHGVHGGRIGWWWMVGNGWYFYPRPIYPYPYPYAPPNVVTPPPSTPYYYYCSNPAGYYPYVPQCFGPWSNVPAR